MANLSLGFGDDERLPDIADPATMGTGLPSAADMFDPTTGIGDRSALGLGSNGSRSLNLAPASPVVSPRSQSDQDYLQNLPAMEKLGLAMQSFKAGFDGTTSPIDTLLAQKRVKEKVATENLLGTINVLQKGTEILRKLPRGSLQRQAIAEELGKIVGPRFAPLFAAAGSEHDDALKNYLDIMGDKEVQQMAVKQCAGASDFGACILKLSTDDSWGKKAEKVVDAKRLGPITTKMRVISERMNGSPLTLAGLTEMNKGNALFTAEEMNTIGRNESFWGDMGFKSRKTIEAAAMSETKPAQANTEWIGMPGGMKQQAVIDRDGNIVRMLGSPIAGHAPSVQVYQGGLTAGIDPTGKPIFVQGSGREGVAPRVIEGVAPPEAAGVRKETAKKADDLATFNSIDTQITQLMQIVAQTEGKFTGATGIKGMVGRVSETAQGVVNPDIATPALDAAARKELLVANLRKKMADANMSKQDKEALDTALGGITSISSTKGSTLRALENLRGFVRDKLVRGDSRPQTFVAGKTYTDASGNRAKFKGGNSKDPKNWEEQ